MKRMNAFAMALATVLIATAARGVPSTASRPRVSERRSPAAPRTTSVRGQKRRGPGTPPTTSKPRAAWSASSSPATPALSGEVGRARSPARRLTILWSLAPGLAS